MVLPVMESICRMFCEYESLLNLSRSLKSLTEFTSDIPGKIAPIVNPIFAKISSFQINPNYLKAGRLEHFGKAVKWGRDYLNFFEVFLTIKKFWEMKNRIDIPWTRKVSTAVQIPQKILESCFIIPADFNIFKLGELAADLGKKGGEPLGYGIWFTRDVIFSVKDVFAFVASIFSIITYKNDYRFDEAHLQRKLNREVTFLNSIRDDLNIVIAGARPVTSLAHYVNNAPARQGGDRQGRQRHKTLAQLQHDLLAVPVNHSDFLIKSDNFIRRFIFENDVQGIPLAIPAALPAPVRNELVAIINTFPTPEARLQRILHYKRVKNRMRTEQIRLNVKKDILGWWYELSKMTIITFGLLATFIVLPCLACWLTPYVAPTVLCYAGFAAEYGLWGSKLFIALAGGGRTVYNAIVIRPVEERLRRALPNPRLVFA